MLQQQGPQHVGSVLGLDLVRDDHLLHHLVGHPRQGLLVQVQKHGPWNGTAQRGLHPWAGSAARGWKREGARDEGPARRTRAGDGAPAPSPVTCPFRHSLPQEHRGAQQRPPEAGLSLPEALTGAPQAVHSHGATFRY